MCPSMMSLSCDLSVAPVPVAALLVLMAIGLPTFRLVKIGGSQYDQIISDQELIADVLADQVRRLDADVLDWLNQFQPQQSTSETKDVAA